MSKRRSRFYYYAFSFLFFFFLTRIIQFPLLLYSFDNDIIFIFSKIEHIHSYSQKVVLASAYFPLNKSKHDKTDYFIWVRSFLRIINCKTIIYTPSIFYEQFYRKEIKKISQNRRNLFNFNCTYNHIFDIPLMKNISNSYKEMHNIDPEKKRHNPELYAIWNCKIFFLREATFIYPNETFYFWVDSGSVRDPFFSKLYNKYGILCNNLANNKIETMECNYASFPSIYFAQNILGKYIDPPLEMCVSFVNPHFFIKHQKNKIKKDVIEGGFFFGSKEGIQKFFNFFWTIHNLWMKKHVFCGKDQQIYNHIFANYYNEINFYVFPAYRAQNIISKRWFSFLSAFTYANPHYIPNQLLHSSFFFKSRIYSIIIDYTWNYNLFKNFLKRLIKHKEEIF